MKVITVAILALAAVALAASAPAATNVLKITPGVANFGTNPVGSVTFKSVTVTNASSEPINLSIGAIKDWDDFGWFVTGTICPDEPLAPGESCVLVVSFSPSHGFEGLKQDQIFRLTATDPLTGAVLDSAELVFFGKAR